MQPTAVIYFETQITALCDSHRNEPPKLEEGPPMSKVPSLSKMSYVDLLHLRGEVDVAMAQAKAAEKEKLRKEMEAMAAQASLQLSDIVASGKGHRPTKRARIPPKYRNPKHPEQTWAGRGRLPIWLAAELKKGRKLEAFKI